MVLDLILAGFGILIIGAVLWLALELLIGLIGWGKKVILLGIPVAIGLVLTYNITGLKLIDIMEMVWNIVQNWRK